MAPSRLHLLAVFALLCRSACASFGDAQPAYRRCVADCAVTGCASAEDCVPSCAAERGRSPADLAPSLSWLRWDCQARNVCSLSGPRCVLSDAAHNAQADCQYRCMHAAERTSSVAAVKYFGKWPFVRRLGMQARVLLRRKSTRSYS